MALYVEFRLLVKRTVPPQIAIQENMDDEKPN
jgi:hypothetical protein